MVVSTQPLPERDATVAEAIAFIDAARRAPARGVSLVELLSERHPWYQGKSSAATARFRGTVLAAFEELGLPDGALLYAIEELESGRTAHLVGGAARALRGLDTRERRIMPFLFKAIWNVRSADDVVAFDTGGAPDSRSPTTALEEVFRTFEWLGPNATAALRELEAMHRDDSALSAGARAALARAIAAIRDAEPVAPSSCCGADLDDETLEGEAVQTWTPGSRRSVGTLDAVAFEDQDGRVLAYGEAFRGRPTVVAFFYTRCDNPNKCSLTVTKMARLQGAISRAGLGDRLATAAITYDPGFDLPARLRSYGTQRGVQFDERNRFLRSTLGFEALREHFGLGVAFGPALVNRHRIELFILHEQGRIAVAFARLQWNVDDVLGRAAMLAAVPPDGAHAHGT